MPDEPRNYGRDILRAALDETDVDVLVTTAHADQLADELSAALHAAGWQLCPLEGT